MTKRVFDVVLSLLGLIVLSPVLVSLALLVALDSRGAILYRGWRTGRGGAPFRIYKFRTMTPDAERTGGYSTSKGDPRITRVGRFVRRYKLDELPQLLNVLLGNMSIVGPRPEVPAYTRLYEGEELLILSVRPGITDLSSLKFIHLDDVLGEDDADRVYEQQVRPVKNALRVQYVKNQSFRNDLSIIVHTLLKLAGVPLWNTRS
jgi:lipopolysaccharide/colanic/teichoic acid biosynthesis glycosyltransferase